MQESYSYDANSSRVKRTRSGATTVYIGMLYEVDQATGASNSYYTFNEQMVAMRGRNAQGTSVTYLHGDHLGSISIATSATGAVLSKQEYTPWGSVRSGNIPQTTLDYTGQRRDDTGLVFLNARYYDPVLARFVSADSIVPGMASGSGGAAMTLGYDDGVELRPLTVDFHEVGFASGLGAENRFTQQNGFQFQLSGQAQREAKYAGGPMNPQALNRYSYTLNNPLRYTDPTGHWTIEFDVGAALMSVYGIRGNFSLAIDNHGNWALLFTGGGGAAIGGTASFTAGVTVSNAPTVKDLEGFAVQLGGEIADVLGVGLEGAAFRDLQGRLRSAISAGLKAGVALEVHGTGTKTVILAQGRIQTTLINPLQRTLRRIWNWIR